MNELTEGTPIASRLLGARLTFVPEQQLALGRNKLLDSKEPNGGSDRLSVFFLREPINGDHLTQFVGIRRSVRTGSWQRVPGGFGGDERDQWWSGPFPISPLTSPALFLGVRERAVTLGGTQSDPE